MNTTKIFFLLLLVQIPLTGKASLVDRRPALWSLVVQGVPHPLPSNPSSSQTDPLRVKVSNYFSSQGLNKDDTFDRTEEVMRELEEENLGNKRRVQNLLLGCFVRRGLDKSFMESLALVVLEEEKDDKDETKAPIPEKDPKEDGYLTQEDDTLDFDSPPELVTYEEENWKRCNEGASKHLEDFVEPKERWE